MAKLNEGLQNAIIGQNMEDICDSLELGPAAKKKFNDLVAALGDVMDFPLTASDELEGAISELKLKIDTEFMNLMSLQMNQLIELKAYLSHISYYLGEKQAEADGRSLQLQYCRYLKEAGVNFALSKHGRTLAERIAKSVTNPDKEAISRIASAQEYAGEVRAYTVAQRLKNILQAFGHMQRTIDARYQQLYKEWTVEMERKNQSPDGSRYNHAPQYHSAQ